jgi:acyl-CoA-binding protein
MVAAISSWPCRAGTASDLAKEKYVELVNKLKGQ